MLDKSFVRQVSVVSEGMREFGRGKKQPNIVCALIVIDAMQCYIV